MQDFRDNEKKQLKLTTKRPFWILFLRNLLWVILVWVLTFSSKRMVQLFCFVFELRKYDKITQIQNGYKIAILKLFAPKGESDHWLTFLCIFAE